MLRTCLNGTHVQQPFRSRRNICAAVFCVPFSPIFMCRIFLYIQKQFNSYVFTLLHVLSKPRGPPARKSSHSTYRFVFPCTVVVVVVVQCPIYSDSIKVWESLFVKPVHACQQIPVLLWYGIFHDTVYDRTTVRTSDVSYVPYEIFENFKFNMSYCTYMFMPDLQYAPWRQLRTVRDNSVKQSVKKGHQ